MTVLTVLSETGRSSTQAGCHERCLTLFTEVEKRRSDFHTPRINLRMSGNVIFSQELSRMALKQGGVGLSIRV